jgi:drug/metabolite transporter (DMT)-like permease
MGLFFIGLFNLISVTVINDGVAVATVSNKLSLVIPVVLAVYLYGEKVAGFKLVGIIAALVAVVLTCYQSEKNRFRRRCCSKTI